VAGAFLTVGTVGLCLCRARHKRRRLLSLLRDNPPSVLEIAAAPAASSSANSAGNATDGNAAVVRFEDLVAATRNWATERLLGEGGFGKVYRADTVAPFQLNCAIKKLNAGAQQGITELLTELQVLGTCKHENILPLLGYCVDPRGWCLIYPLMEGGSFDDRIMLGPGSLARLGAINPTNSFALEPLGWSSRLRILRDTFRAIAYLHTPADHKAVVLHRDIKPANILLDTHLNARLGDAGLAKQMHEFQEGRTHVTTRNMVGTMGYIDPLYSQTGKYCQSTDGYALGITVLVALTGKSASVAHDECSEMFDDAERAVQFAAAGFPGSVAVSLARVIKALTYSRSASGRKTVPSALQDLEDLCANMQGDEQQEIPVGIAIDEVEAMVRECVVCMAAPRAVRFGCGHACCCESCAVLLAGSRCPACRMPILRTSSSLAADPTFIQPIGNALYPSIAEDPAETQRGEVVVV